MFNLTNKKSIGLGIIILISIFFIINFFLGGSELGEYDFYIYRQYSGGRCAGGCGDTSKQLITSNPFELGGCHIQKAKMIALKELIDRSRVALMNVDTKKNCQSCIDGVDVLLYIKYGNLDKQFDGDSYDFIGNPEYVTVVKDVLKTIVGIKCE